MPAGRFSKDIYPGARFGRLTVVERIPREGNQRSRVRCVCDCGKEIIPNADNLKRLKSCGCWNREELQIIARSRTLPGRGYGKLIVGAKFGRLIVIERIEVNGKYTERVLCQCSCGKNSSPLADDLIYGMTKSCGCLAKDSTTRRNKETAKFEGITQTEEGKLAYKTWRSLRLRVSEQARYQGVKVCRRLWRSPWGIVKTLGFRPTINHTLDRYPIHNGNYTCGECPHCRENGWEKNVRWATRKQQAENRGQFNISLTAFGKTLLLSQWCETSGISTKCFSKRLKRGWSIEKALTTPDKQGHCYVP